MRILLLPPFMWIWTALAMGALHACAPLQVLWPWPWGVAGLVPVVAGLGVAKWHARLFTRLGTNIQTFGEPGTLTTAGLFRFSRNPMYLGFVLALAGLAATLGSLTPWFAWLAYVALMNAWYIPFEERALARKFGPAYAAYCQRVRRWL